VNQVAYMRTDTTVRIIYGTNIKTIYRHTSHEYITIINDDTFMKNVKVQFYMEFSAVLCHFMF
jgi:ADP-dependent phosphofructokinase/glucokinase